MKKIILGLTALTAVVVIGCKNVNNEAQKAIDEAKEGATELVNEVKDETKELANEVKDWVNTREYKVVTSETVIEWVGSKPAGKHNGTIELKDGGFDVKDGIVTGGDFVIDMGTITVLDLEGDDKAALENHLKGTGKEDDAVDHFFNINKYPVSTFALKSVKGKNVIGDLTIKGKTKEITFPATVTVAGNEVSLVSEPFTINRVDFDVNYGSKSVFDNLKDKFINDNIELVIKAKAKK